MNLFHSARLKLTGFYFAVLVVFCLVLTFGVRAFTTHELERGDDAQRGAVHSLVQRLYDPGPRPSSDRFFATAQNRQADVTRQALNRDFLVMDVVALAIGAILSYWYAGRTLRPIEAVHEKQKRFTADASHELRTPLASMRIENEVFLRQKKINEAEAREQITSNLEEVDRLERLAVSLLALSRYENAQLPRQKLAIQKLVAEAVTSAKHNPDAAEVTFTEKLADATVLGEPESLVQLVGILLDNAVKYGPPAGPVELTGTLHGNTYWLRIRDHGRGIAAADLPHIFERMYRGDKARSNHTPGHGIGLSLALEIAQANEARLSAANHRQGGAEFTLQLPIAK